MRRVNRTPLNRVVLRHRTIPTRRVALSRTTLSRIALAGYSAVIALIVFWPTPVDRPVQGQVTEVITAVQNAGATAVTYNGVEIAANVAMFIPLGAFIVLSLVRCRWWQAVLAALACAAFSGLIELIQLLFISERFASPIDIAANGFGGALGVLVALAVLSIRAHRHRRAGALA